MTELEPALPQYDGACLSNVVPSLLDRHVRATDWLPEPAKEATQVVLLVLDGLGWEQLQERSDLAPNLTRVMQGGPITSIAPTTTATALTSIVTGRTPAEHGVIGYRVRVNDTKVLNVLHWKTGDGDANELIPPGLFQVEPAFRGADVPMVIKAEFIGHGFSLAHMAGARLVGWRVPSTMVLEVGRLLREGEPFVYAYYEGMDKVAHEYGLSDHYAAELVATDRLIGDLIKVLPPGAALVVTADHGQVEVLDPAIVLSPDLMRDVSLLSGEGRFRWLHAREGATEDLVSLAEDLYGHLAWVRTRDEMVKDGWFGGPLRPEVEQRLGDVALVARDAVAFADPADTGGLVLRSRHGSLTTAELLVPLVSIAL